MRTVGRLTLAVLVAVAEVAAISAVVAAPAILYVFGA